MKSYCECQTCINERIEWFALQWEIGKETQRHEVLIQSTPCTDREWLEFLDHVAPLDPHCPERT